MVQITAFSKQDGTFEVKVYELYTATMIHDLETNGCQITKVVHL